MKTPDTTRWAGAQSIGARKVQEDAFRLAEHRGDRTRLVALLADGMGGHAAGDVAARIAVNTFHEVLAEEDNPVNGLERALDQTDRAIAAHVKANQERAGMGCTLVALVLDGNALNWVSIGDSPLFHIAGNTITRLNEDHSMAPRLDAAAARGEITQDEARTSRSRNALLHAITGEGIRHYDIRRHPLMLEEGDWLVLASDGLETLSRDDIVSTVSDHKGASADVMAQALLAGVAGIQKPGQDNTSVVCCNI